MSLQNFVLLGLQTNFQEESEMLLISWFSLLCDTDVTLQCETKLIMAHKPFSSHLAIPIS